MILSIKCIKVCNNNITLYNKDMDSFISNKSLVLVFVFVFVIVIVFLLI